MCAWGRCGWRRAATRPPSRSFGRPSGCGPHDAKAHTDLGLALAGTGQYAQAIAQHELALRWQPGLAEAYCNLGTAFIAAGRRAEAIEAYRTALRLKPALASAHLNLGLALVEIGHRGEAAEAFQTYSRVAQPSPGEQAMIPRVVLWLQALQP